MPDIAGRIRAPAPWGAGCLPIDHETTDQQDLAIAMQPGGVSAHPRNTDPPRLDPMPERLAKVVLKGNI